MGKKDNETATVTVTYKAPERTRSEIISVVTKGIHQDILDADNGPFQGHSRDLNPTTQVPSVIGVTF
jgi:hypothetical protein